MQQEKRWVNQKIRLSLDDLNQDMLKMSDMCLGITEGQSNWGRNNASRSYGQQFSKIDENHRLS